MDNLQAAANRWLTAHDDNKAGIYTFSSCITLSDITGDGDTKLIVADLGSGTFNMKLRVYKGTQLLSENTMIDLPTGVVDFYMDSTQPRIPAIAVASGPNIYVYKNMRPYFKFTLPSLEICPREKELWDKYGDNRIEISELRDGLLALKDEIGEGMMTPPSQKLFTLMDMTQMKNFLDIHKGFPLKRSSVITCISVLNKSHAEEGSVSCLVLGTEANLVYILDPEAFTIMESMTLPAAPTQLSVTGLYDVDFRIVISCRNGSLVCLKRGWQRAKSIALLGNQSIGVIHRDKTILVATMDDKISSYSSKGRLHWSQKLPSSILCICPVEITEKSVFYVAVALSNNQVHMYHNKHLIDIMTFSDSISAMKFGRFGRENSALVCVTLSGGIIIKILKRTAMFDANESLQSTSTSIVSSQPLNIPKKTKLFVDQTVRERENSKDMHEIFQHDIYKLRLRTARAYVKSMQISDNPISVDQNEPIKLSAQVLGLGPTYKIIIGLSNTSVDKLSKNLELVFHNDDRVYVMEKDVIEIPFLIPGVDYTFATLVECVSDLGIADVIRVFLLKESSPKPILSAVINMPITEII
ncbi:BBS1 [Lepeophtheirus salmonis]|nr:BBS1 [Lepeophtheirus salmonis]CAF2845362.1 BBS1 [Lepeophtheirus salmonis]